MIIFIIIVIVFFVILGFAGRSKKRMQGERDRLELTAEHQRIQRETPEHPNAKLGTEEFIVAGMRNREGKRTMSSLFNGVIIVLLLIAFYIYATS